MLVAVVSDTHLPRGARRLPGECVERLRAADLILHAGDVVAASFLEELRALGPPVQAVNGNMDEPALQAALPNELVVEAGEARIGMVHIPGPAAGREARLAARFPGCDAVVYGHTHVPQVERHGGVWILNPGSPTERRRAPTHTMLELRVTGRELVPKVVHFGGLTRTSVRATIERMCARIVVIAAVVVFCWTAFVRPLGAHGPQQHYVVKPYDTLWAIASSHYAGDTRDAVYRIGQVNHLGSAPLRPGQTLVLP